MSNQYKLAPPRDGFSCSDPDMSMPMPGSITHWPDQPFLPALRPPPGLLADPWDKPAAQSSNCHRNTLPPIQIFDGTNPRPRFF